MKTFKRIFAAVLALSMVFLFVSCGSFSKIKKNFVDAGYEYVKTSGDDEDSKRANTIVAQLEEGEISCTLHTFRKELAEVPVIGKTYTYAFVLEFKSNAELMKAFDENGSETLKGLIKDAQNSKYVNDNCILIIPVLNHDEKVEIFNK